MALFGSKKTKTSAPAAKKTAAVSTKTKTGTVQGNPNVLRRPHVTEKAASGNEKGVYVFEVSKTANKREIMQAVTAFYKVVPIKIAIVTKPPKTVFVKGRSGVRPRGKKAYVYLKEGEKIEIV